MGECPSHLFRSFWAHLCATFKPMWSSKADLHGNSQWAKAPQNMPTVNEWISTLSRVALQTPIRKMGHRRFDYYISKWYAHPTSKESLAFWLGMWPKTIQHPFFLDEAAASAMILCHAVWICSALRDLRTCRIDSIRTSQSLEFHFIKLWFRKREYMWFHVFFYSEFSKIKKWIGSNVFPHSWFVEGHFVFNLQKKSCEYSLILTIWSEKSNSQVLFFTFDPARWRSSRLRSFR